MRTLILGKKPISCTSLRRRRRGTAAVECAVVMPLLLLLLAGIIEFGQAFRIEHSLSVAARRGVRSAIVDGAKTAKIEKTVKKQVTQMLGLSIADVTVNVAVNGSSGTDLSQAVENDEISVEVSIPFAKAGAGFFSNTFSNAVLRSTSTLEHE